MAASPQVIDAAPLFLTGLTNTYNALHFRKPFGDVIGQGVVGSDSFRVRQRAAGANMSVDLQTASVQNRAYVRDTNSGVVDGGMYRVQFNSSTQTNLNIAAADPTNPRIDSIYLCVEDSQDTGSNSRATGVVVTGTATGGATLDNRTGVGAAPSGMSSILLADVLVAAAASSIANAVIRDRRPYGVRGFLPSPFTNKDEVCFEPVAAAAPNTTIQNTASYDAQQAAALMYLPRRIEAATKLKYKINQGGTANLTNSVNAIFDASGRLLANTTAAAYGGTASQQVSVDLTLTNQGGFNGTYDEGYYWVFQGNAAGTGSATIAAYGVVGAITGNAIVQGPNLYVYATSGGVTVPTTILGLTDVWGVTGAAVVARTGVPVPMLTVG